VDERRPPWAKASGVSEISPVSCDEYMEMALITRRFPQLTRTPASQRLVLGVGGGAVRPMRTGLCKRKYDCPLCRAKLAPLSESGGAVLLEIGPAVEMTFLVEIVVDRGVDGDELLQTSRSPEARHHPLSSSKRQV